MSMTLDVDRQVFPMLAQIEDDSSRHTAEFPMVVGRILQDAPDHSTLRHLRSELAATADRLRGEPDVHEDSGTAAVTAWIVWGLSNVITGWIEQSEADVSAVAVLGSSFRSSILTALTEGPARPSELADKLERSRSQVSEALSRLTERGLVTNAESAVDGRSRLYELTAEGRAVADD